MGTKLKDLLEAIEELDGPEEAKYAAIHPDEIRRMTESAALIFYRGEEHWLPFSQLRNLDGDLYASHWILKQKDIDF